MLPPPSQKSSNRFDPGMISPDALLELDAADLGGDGAPLQAIEPAVGPPGQRVGHRVGVFHAEAGEQDLGIAVGHVVAVAVGIEEQIRRLEDEHAAVAERQAARQVQPGDEVLGAVGAAVAVGVLQDRDPVGALSARAAAARGRGRRRSASSDRPSPASGPAGLGYCRYWMTQSRPRSSNSMATGWRIIGSPAKSRTSRPSATVIRPAASSGG